MFLSMFSILMQYVAASLALFLLGISVYIWTNRAAPLVTGLPTIKGYIPIFGHLFVVRKNILEFHDFVTKCAKEFDPLASWHISYFSVQPVIFVSGECNVQYFMKSNINNYVLPRRRTTAFKDLFGEGIFGSQGEAWRAQRKAAAHIFSARQINDHMSQIIVRDMNVLIDEVFNPALESNKPVDMQQIFFRLTLESFTEWAFGTKLNSLTQKEVPFSTSFDECQRLLMRRLFDPVWRIKRIFGIGSEAELKKHLKVLDEFAERTITTRRATFESLSEGSGSEVGSSLVSWYMRESKKNGKVLTNKELRDVVLNFMIGGRDTTATLLSWFVYELTQNLEVEEKIVAEIKSTLAEASEINEDSAEHKYQIAVRSMPYLEAAILETLRLHPSIPQDDREALEDDVLPDGTKVPKGTSVCFSPYLAGRNVALWGEGCYDFKPQRWLLEGSQTLVRDAYNQYFFTAFGAGPRICLGKTLAITEAKLVAMMLLEKFKFSLVPGQLPIQYQVAITLNIKNGLFCMLQPRV